MITPLDGGQETVTTTTSLNTDGAFSPQYVRVKSLQSRPTEWVPGGRPIYRRLPSSNQTYQVNFEADGKIGYVYLPYGNVSSGLGSLEVVSSDDFKEIIIQGGNIIWEYGRSRENPVVINLQDLDVREGRYFLGYELLLNDDELFYQYEATDYYLYGETLNITSSSDSTLGWRYQPSNVFTPEESLFWKNSDNFFPTYAQPTESYIGWTREGGAAFTTVKVKMPQDVVVPPDVVATLYYRTGSTLFSVVSTTAQYDSGQGFFLLTVDVPTFQTSWQVSWSNGDGSPYLPIAVDSIEVSGILNLRSRPSNPIPRASLVMYFDFAVPEDTTLCQLAWVSVNSRYEIEAIQDARNTTTQNYVPVADWLTRPWDDNLIRLYEQVGDYSVAWMSPTTCMDFEYKSLTSSGITVI